MSWLTRPRILLALLPIFSAASFACSGNETAPSGGGGGGNGASLRRFGSEAELARYLEEADPEPKNTGSSGGFADAGSPSSAPSESSAGASSDSKSSAPANETITNNQEAGVDEGGIVKNIGEALVVLRKGRLYAVSIAAAGAPQQTDSMAVAPMDELNKNVWYDEMLVRGDRLYVIGYRYGLTLTDDAATATAPGVPSYASHGATEVASFRLVNGKIERLKTLFIESNDYFSGSNYASRMIDGKLVFYMPHGAWSSPYAYGATAKKREVRIPRFFTPNADGTFTKGAPVFAPTDVYVPLDLPESPSFHTVVKCELPDDGSFTCNARSLLSSYGREHYVTPGAVFLWSLPRAYMFRFEDLSVVAHKAAARPQDQFSFKLDSGVLHIVGEQWTAPKPSSGSGSGSDPISQGDSASPSGGGGSTPPKAPAFVVESLPIADFDIYGEQSLEQKERVVALGTPDGSYRYVSKNRFVGQSVFLGVSSYSYSPNGGSGSSTNKVIRFELSSGATTVRDVPGQVVRIEPLGEARALVAVQSASALDLESLPINGALAPQGSVHVEGLSQGESRSHGFFFKPAANGGGAFGLPVMNNEGSSGGWYGSGISNIGFWAVQPSGAMNGLGVVSSSKETGICETSCVDWYGNTRPIFLGSRAFALMGSELAEIAVEPAAVRIGTPALLTK